MLFAVTGVVVSLLTVPHWVAERRAVERHVKKARPAAGRQRCRAGGETFPFSAPGFVEVHVRVNKSRKQSQSMSVEFARG